MLWPPPQWWLAVTRGSSPNQTPLRWRRSSCIGASGQVLEGEALCLLPVRQTRFTASTARSAAALRPHCRRGTSSRPVPAGNPTARGRLPPGALFARHRLVLRRPNESPIESRALSLWTSTFWKNCSKPRTRFNFSRQTWGYVCLVDLASPAQSATLRRELGGFYFGRSVGFLFPAKDEKS